MENGREKREREMEYRYGLMGRNMMGSGDKIRLMGGESCIMLMEIFMMVSGKMTKLTEKANTLTPTVQPMMENGSKISSMAMGWKHGQMVQNTKVITTMVRKMGQENFISLMVLFTQGNSL